MKCHAVLFTSNNVMVCFDFSMDDQCLQVTESLLMRSLPAGADNVENMTIQVVSIYLLLLDALLTKDGATEIQALSEPLLNYLERFKRVYDQMHLYSHNTSGGGYSYYQSYGYYGTGYSGGSNSRYDNEATMTHKELQVSKKDLGL